MNVEAVVGGSCIPYATRVKHRVEREIAEVEELQATKNESARMQRFIVGTFVWSPRTPCVKPSIGLNAAPG